ncbi:MAG: hypothetical protein L0Z62_03305 [Gemmataceae bacterium]|nr:hypothetical protein [Gemmataceae bacterium]
MMRLLGCALLGLAVCTASLQAQGEKGKDKKGVKEVEITGKVKDVDLKKKAFTITLTEGGKDRTFLVNNTTKFVGPKGGVSKEGLEDDRMAKGYEVKVVAAADSKTAREVRLPVRKPKAADKDKKEKK